MSRQIRALTVVSHPPNVLDTAIFAAAEPQPRFLNCVFRVIERTKHPIGDTAQVRPILLKSLSKPFRHTVLLYLSLLMTNEVRQM
jgi:hypothetical protein